MRIFFTTLLSCIILSISAQTSYDFYIAPDGDDTNDGLSETSPFSTLEKARDEAQAITGNSEITIWLLDGDYYLDQTFQLNAADSGSATKSITYRAQNKHQAKLHLNRDIPVTSFQDVTDPGLINRMRPEAVGHIKMLDLSTMNLTNINTWPDYFPSNNQELLRVYAGGEQMQLSQFPNDTMMTMKVVTQNEPGIFEYRGTRHHNWLEAINDGLWFQGYWRVAWQFDAVKTMSIDTTNRLVYQTTSVPGGIGSKYHRPEGNGAEPYKAINLLEEIDLPGEWCIHFSTQKLYIWIPDNVDDIQLLDLKQPIIRVTDVSNTTFRDLELSYSAGQGIVVENGDENLIAGCDIYNVIDDAVQIINGTNHTVQSNDLHHLGAGGIFLSGGNRQTLTPANHSAINNHIYEFGQVKVIYAGAVYTPQKYDDNNVGMYVAHNEIHGTPHVGIWYSGNNHVFEYNNIYDICRVSNDMGAFYSWNDWTSYGNVIRYNYIHDAEQAHGTYFDDGDSGEEVYGNIMSHIDVAVFIGGGHDNIITGNMAVNCEKTVHVDNRGVSRGYNLDNTGMVNRVLSVDYQNPPWSIQYPPIVNILDPSYSQELPVGNVVDCNVALNTAQVVDFSAQNAMDWEMTLGTNYSDADISISDPATTDLAAILAATGYDGENCLDSSVNWDILGLIEDEYRSFESVTDCNFDVNTDNVLVETSDFNTVGNATAQTANCFELTPDLYNKTGSVWYQKQINLENDFELNFNLNFGSRGAGGGDGMAFVLQPLSNASEIIDLGNVLMNQVTLDGWDSNMVINESDVYTNTSGTSQKVDIKSFSFHAGQEADPVTPFVVKVNGDNDFTVLKVGTTRTAADYNIGLNTFDFKDGGASYVLNDGETIAIGFLDASADGLDSGIGSVVSKDNDITSTDEIWYSGNGSNLSGSVVEGQAPIAGNNTILTFNRNYHFDIRFSISNPNNPENQVVLEAENLGYSGITPSASIEFDTYTNADAFDSNNDHISFQKNGNVKHNASGYLDLAVKKNATGNMEDGNFHPVTISWNATTKELTYVYDGNETATVTQDIVNTIFGGNPNVFFGWTASTSSKRNQHQVCVQSLAFKESIMANAIVTGVTCDNSGSIDLNVTGGAAPYTYLWSDGSTNEDLLSIVEGTYTVTITDNCEVELVNVFTVSDLCLPCVFEKVKNNTFEGGWGAWNDGGDHCQRILSSGIGTDGNWSVRLRNGTSTSVTTSDNFNMSAYSEAKVEFKYQCRSMDNASEGFQLEMSTDGGSNFSLVEDWYRDTDFTNTTNYTEEVVVPGPFTSTTQFRFRCMANGNFDHVYLDRINVSACEGTTNQSRIIAEDDLMNTELSITNLYPNPTKDYVNIEYISTIEANVEISIYDPRGQMILSGKTYAQEGENTFQLNVDKLNAGIYMIEINDGNKKATKRLVIIK